MRLTKDQIRRKIDKEIEKELISEGIMDAIENYATIGAAKMFGPAGSGGALLKALSVDLGRVAKDMSDIGKLLKPFGMDDSFSLLLKSKEEVAVVAKALYAADPAYKAKIKEEFYDLAESMKKMIVSLNSANPEPISSFVASTTFASLPLERLLIDAAPALGEIFAKIQGNPLGNFIMKIAKLTTVFYSLGVFGIIFNDPITFFENLGLIISAVIDEGKFTHLISSISDTAGEAISLTESQNIVFDKNRMKLLAGIK